MTNSISAFTLLLAIFFARASHAQDSTASAKKPVRVCAGGDVTLGTNLDTVWAKTGARRLKQDFGLSADPEALLAPLKPFFADADVVLVNVEMAIGDGPAVRKCNSRSQNCYMFRAPVGAA